MMLKLLVTITQVNYDCFAPIDSSKVVVSNKFIHPFSNPYPHLGRGVTNSCFENVFTVAIVSSYSILFVLYFVQNVSKRPEAKS